MRHMNKPRFQFSQVVVVEHDLIGVVLKTWGNTEQGYSYEVYVRSYNVIQTYGEDEIQHFVYSKELSDEEKEFY